METIELQQQKKHELHEDIRLLQKLKRKLNLKRAYGQEIERTIDQEISFLYWEAENLARQEEQESAGQDNYTPDQAPKHDILSEHMIHKIRERILVQGDEKKDAQGLV